MLKLSVIVLTIVMSQVLATPAKVEHSIQDILQNKGTANIIVSMKKKTFPVLSQLNAQSFKSRSDRVYQVAGSLKALAADSQKSVLTYLATNDNIEVENLWVTNKIIVKGATAEIVQSLANTEDVDSIIEDSELALHRPVKRTSIPTPKKLQWGVERIEAPAAWEQGYRGQGVVVGTIDTGVRYTHKSLYRGYRHEHAWYDPIFLSSLPYDNDGHGSHTMGTILGADGIGVAPDSKWIACRGCDTTCPKSALLQCGQFMVCPTLPNGTDEDCSSAPNLVSNSWGGGGGDSFYDEVVAAWAAAGIIPVFSNGNNGPDCKNTGSPADSYYTPVIGVGATNINEELAEFSSRGPSSHDPRILKPDISAPGVNVESATGSGDQDFEVISGTSMAAPHVSGALALLLSNGTELTYEAITTLLYNGAVHTIAETGENCGAVSESVYPNNNVGWGRLSVQASISRLRKLLANH